MKDGQGVTVSCAEGETGFVYAGLAGIEAQDLRFDTIPKTRTEVMLNLADPAAAARREYLDETGGRYVHVLADGDIHTSGDLARAIACGADAVLLGTPLAAAAEAPGQGWYWPSAAAHPSLPRGSLLDEEIGQRPSLDQVRNGPAEDPFGSLNLVGGLRRSMAKAGYSDLKEFQKVALTVGS